MNRELRMQWISLLAVGLAPPGIGYLLALLLSWIAWLEALLGFAVLVLYWAIFLFADAQHRITNANDSTGMHQWPLTLGIILSVVLWLFVFLIAMGQLVTVNVVGQVVLIIFVTVMVGGAVRGHFLATEWELDPESRISRNESRTRERVRSTPSGTTTKTGVKIRRP